MYNQKHSFRYQSPAKKEFKRFIINFSIGLLLALAFCIGQAMTMQIYMGKPI
jgi:hypothetical protein